MKPSRISDVLTQISTNRWPAFIWGPPGAGKSSVVREVADRLNQPLRDIRATLLDPTDLRGIPAVVDGKAVWCPPDFLPGPEEEHGILFFDELNAAPPLVQASLYQLTLDRRIGEYELPEGWSIIAAGNRSEDQSITFRMPAALANRFIHLDFEIDIKDWRAWAVLTGIHPLVLAFISTRPNLLFSMESDETAFPTPRSWEMASDTLHTLESVDSAQDVLKGIVGSAAVLEFMGYCSTAINQEKIEEIIAAPKTMPLPEELGDLYALVNYLPAHADREDVQSAAETLLDRLPPEMSVLLCRDLMIKSPDFCRTEGYITFAKKHRKLLT